MKVKYLKEHLQNLPDDMEVLISHYDGYERVYTHNFGVYPGTAGYVTINSDEWEDWVYPTQETYEYCEEKKVLVLDV